MLARDATRKPAEQPRPPTLADSSLQRAVSSFFISSCFSFFIKELAVFQVCRPGMLPRRIVDREFITRIGHN